MKWSKNIGWTVLAAAAMVATAQQSPATPDLADRTPASEATAPQTAPTGAATQAQVPADSKSPSNSQPVRPSKPAISIPGDAAPGIDSTHYIIGAEDALQITVWREPTLSGTLPVRPDGMISMVLLGDLPAAGLTPTQLSADITQKLHKYFQDPPSVTVQVMAVNSQKIYLIGEVGHVGSVPLSAAMSPLQAIAAAGGLSPFANSKHIYILRGSGPTQQKIPFNYKQALKGDNHQPIVLRPGDTIVVP